MSEYITYTPRKTSFKGGISCYGCSYKEVKLTCLSRRECSRYWSPAGVKSPYPRVKHTSVLLLLRLSQSDPRRKIKLIEGNAKCRHLKNGPGKGLCGRCLSVWGPEPHTLPFPTHCTRVYRARIFKPFKEPMNRFPAWRTGTTTLFDGRQAA
jgi:hypothetical protein